MAEPLQSNVSTIYLSQPLHRNLQNRHPMIFSIPTVSVRSDHITNEWNGPRLCIVSLMMVAL